MDGGEPGQAGPLDGLDKAVEFYRNVVDARRPKGMGKGEWLPRPHTHVMIARNRVREDVVLRIVAGPMGLWQIVRRDTGKTLARGFRTKEQARVWIGRAVKHNLLPEGTIEVEQ